MDVKDYYRVLAPRPVALVSTIDTQGNPNTAPFSFVMPISIDPPLVAIASAPKRRTLKNIRETKEFILNIAPEELLEKVWFCAQRYSGKNKIKDAGLTEIKSERLKVPKIKECIGWIECKLEFEKDLGDHILVVGRVVSLDSTRESYKKTLLHISSSAFVTPGKALKV
jgi:flavin reductase (DIM6/NTAB) family NADH-FMN oxidoreductase RutF